MACVTASVMSISPVVAATARPSARQSQPCVRIFARPTCRPNGSRLQQLQRANFANAVNSGCWTPTGACGPTSSYRRWTSGPTQRSFENWAEQASNSMWFPVDVIETAQQYTFVADVPGLGKNDIKVQVNKDRVLSISGERQQRSKASGAATSSSTSGDVIDVGSSETDKDDNKVQRKRQERRFGTFKRTWNLPEDADVSQIKASVDQGVLTLNINRVQPAEPEVTTIPIN